jgi:hypothetical protein
MITGNNRVREGIIYNPLSRQESTIATHIETGDNATETVTIELNNVNGSTDNTYKVFDIFLSIDFILV